MKRSLLRFGAVSALVMILACGLALAPAAEAAPDTPAEFVVTNEVLRPASDVPPLGANNYGGCGAVEWARNNFVQNSGNEPAYWKNLHRVTACGGNWFEIDGGGVSWWDLWGSGFLSGADVRIYRIVDAGGQPIVGDGYLDMARADHVIEVGRTHVIPAGAPGYPDGGWVVTQYGDVYPNAWIRGANLSTTDAVVENGRAYWYTVVAVDAAGRESEMSEEVTATPEAGIDTPPHILVGPNDDRFPDVRSGQGLRWEPSVVGGAAPVTWSVVEDPMPAGLTFDQATGVIDGVPAADAPPDSVLRLRVTDARGRTDERAWVVNPSDAQPASDQAPAPPTGVRAIAGDGCVTLTWRQSPSAGVVAYRLKRSTRPAAEQANRVYLEDGAPKLERYDYIVLEREFNPFDMRVVHPRVRGIGNPVDSPNWHWRSDTRDLRFSFEAHATPVPAEMTEPGETCLRVDAPSAGETSINQYVMIGAEIQGESTWYGQLEPGKRYHLEVWLRQEGLGNGGEVVFSYARGYPDIRQAFTVTGEWQRFTYDFVGPERPTDVWHFGHTFTFTGPGALWMDNCSIARVDTPEDAAKPYVPNRTVFDEFLASQPDEGPKGAQRCWVLKRDMTMESITSLHPNSQVRPDWSTSVSGTEEMTLPFALEYCRLTGDSPETRVVPWIVIQHILHTEAEWQGLVEYLAAPYDPAVDTPESKPWAYRRYTQRGVGTPWVDEFREFLIEFGNETWHNGHFEDWLGFQMRGAIWQGGREYGMFAQHLIDAIKESPYWSDSLEGRIRFVLGDGYPRRDVGDGWELTYAEEAMRECPGADILAHANYVGPKWETSDSGSGVFDDHGVQATLFAWLRGNLEDFRGMKAAREKIAATGKGYSIAAYESGPSGYTLPGSAGPEIVEVNERYGKSLAMGVAALDAWLGAYEQGWTYQNFLGYAQGQYWSSHTWFSNGFRPSPGWLALELRNRFARGDLMAVETTSVPDLRFYEATYPLVGVYAMRDSDRWSVFVLSRKLGGNHDGFDFGDGGTPVTLSLPFASAESITLHRLTGDPRANNRETMNIDIESLPVPAGALANGAFQVNAESGGLASGMPPGSIYLYVFDGVR